LAWAPGQASDNRTSVASGTDPDAPRPEARPAPEAASVEGLEEVVVTAQKREERLLDTPQSVSVLSSDALGKLGAVQFSDFANTVPGLSFTTVGAGFSQITLRGVTAGVDIGHTVGTYIDEVPVGFSSAATGVSLVSLDEGLFDIDRIEVLRGPQGTLYGASTLGGLIKYVNKEPQLSGFASEVRTGVSATADGGVSYLGSLAVNVPMRQDLALRAGAYESHDGGFVDNVALGRKDINHSDVYGARGDLLYKPTDALTVRFDAFVQNISRSGQSTVDFNFAGAPEYGKLEQYRQFSEPYEQHFRLLSATLKYDFGAADLTAISSYQALRADYFVDITGQFVPLLQTFFGRTYGAVGYSNLLNVHKFTQEVRVGSHSDAAVEWLAGLFYTREATGGDYSTPLRDPNGASATNDIFAFSGPGSFKEYAGFADLTWHLSSRFDVTGGARYAKNDQSQTQISSGLLLGVAPGEVSVIPTRTSSDHALTYLANARYHLSEHATAYLRYATGYRPGGPNTVASNPATGAPVAPPTFQPDKLKSYEGGFKAESEDRRFGIDLAVYYIDWRDIHILAYVNGVGITANAPGGASVRGSELSLTARPLPDLTLSGAFAYQNAKLSAADANLGASDGERLPGVPRFTAALNADYLLSGVPWRPRLGATLRYVTDRSASFDHSPSIPQYTLPAYPLVDLRAGLAPGRVDLQLYIHNLFNRFAEFSADTSRGAAQLAIARPRTIGVTATVNF